jgi:poly-beta-1,6-N-acetyl-D-glucosamine synthase
VVWSFKKNRILWLPNFNTWVINSKKSNNHFCATHIRLSTFASHFSCFSTGKMRTTFFQYLFWAGTGIVLYTYVGYGLCLWLLVRIKRLVATRASAVSLNEWPCVTLIVCAYNEQDWIAEKIRNSLQLRYPNDRIRFLIITDGSDDDTPNLSRQVLESSNRTNAWQVLHRPERRGKIAAFHRGMGVWGQWTYPHIIVSTDANTLLNPEALERMVAHFANPQVGAVAGEKRIQSAQKAAASSAGEGIYWKYESLLKRWDYELWSVVGAAGELFAFRAEAYQPVPNDTLIEDFYLTLRMAQQGWRVAYEPEAYAVETASANVHEELKRKIRIAAGGLQAIGRLRALLNVFRYGTLSFQYISHRVLRWTLAPLALPLIFVSNAVLAAQGAVFYQITLGLQVLFYAASALGHFFAQRQIKVKALFVPYYFCVMNYAVYAGLVRLWRGRQSVLWERAERAK